MWVGGILTLQTLGQEEPWELSEETMKQLLFEMGLYLAGKINHHQKTGNMSIQIQGDPMGLHHMDFDIQKWDRIPIGKNHVPLKGWTERQK
jgi:hypothetical protein